MGVIRNGGHAIYNESVNKGGGGGTSFEDLGYSPFSETETYAAGDVVIYSGGLKKFTTAHEGAWDDDDATDTSVAEEAESEHAGRVAGDNILDVKISGLSKLVNADGAIEEFDATKRYAYGSYAIHDGYAYRFTKIHEAGAWDDEDAVKTCVYDELLGLRGSGSTDIHIKLQSSDGELQLQGIQVTVSFDDGSPAQTLMADAQGECMVTVEKGTVVTVAPVDQTGYKHVSAMTFRAVEDERYVYFTYDLGTSGAYCTVVFRVELEGAGSESYSFFAGKNVTISLSDGQAVTANINANGTATFLNVKKFISGRTLNPKVKGFTTPSSQVFDTEYDTVYVNVTYSLIRTAGIYMVNQDGDDVEYDSWDNDDTLVAIHVAASELVESGCDYYVPVNELVSGWFTNANKKAWSTSKIRFPNVKPYDYSPTYYDGQASTLAMLSDAADLEITSPAAEFATSQSFTLKGMVYYGFIGTMQQIKILLDNFIQVNAMLNIGGGLTAVYNVKDLWASMQFPSSSQYSATGASGYLYDRGWNDGRVLDKVKDSYWVIPFFSI